MYFETDVLVIGSGLAGLCAGLCAKEQGANVIIASKGKGATPNINGFQAWEDGSEEGFSLLFQQVIQTGQHINDPALVSSALRSSRQVYTDLHRWGIDFLIDTEGNLLPKKYSNYVRGYKTQGELGKQASSKLSQTFKASGGIILDNTEILYPVLHQGRLAGAMGIRNKETIAIQAKAVVVACGGIGSLFSRSTYPKDVCAGYVPFALLAGAELADMEFLQYEPAVCCALPQLGYMPLPTKLWSCGAKLINGRGEHFLPLYYGIQESELRKNGPLDKDLMARRIDTEIQLGRGTPNSGIWYDARFVPQEEITQFTLKMRRLAAVHVDLHTTPVEICPGPHSHMGGIVIDPSCSSRIPGLYAAGESASGFLGASRMTGFGGASAAILGRIAGRSAAEYANIQPFLASSLWYQEVQSANKHVSELCQNMEDSHAILQTVPPLLDSYFGIIKDKAQLHKGLSEIEALLHRTPSTHQSATLKQQIHAFGAAYTAKSMFTAALLRQESRGCFFRKDFPDQDAVWNRRIVHHLSENSSLQTAVRPPIRPDLIL